MYFLSCGPGLFVDCVLERARPLLCAPVMHHIALYVDANSAAYCMQTATRAAGCFAVIVAIAEVAMCCKTVPCTAFNMAS